MKLDVGSRARDRIRVLPFLLICGVSHLLAISRLHAYDPVNKAKSPQGTL